MDDKSRGIRESGDEDDGETSVDPMGTGKICYHRRSRIYALLPIGDLVKIAKKKKITFKISTIINKFNI